MSGEHQDSVFPSYAYAHESCFCNHLSFQLSWDLGKDLNAGQVKHVKGAGHCRSSFWLQFAEGSANREPLAVNTLNACESSCLDKFCKNTSKATQSKFLQTSTPSCISLSWGIPLRKDLPMTDVRKHKELLHLQQQPWLLTWEQGRY